MVVIFTDQNTLAIVFVGVLAILGLGGVAYALLSVGHEATSHNWKDALTKMKAAVIAQIENNQSDFANMAQRVS